MLQRTTHVLIVAGVLAVSQGVVAQTSPPATPPPVVLTLEQALQYAAEHYPTIRAAKEQENAAAADVTVARAAYLPRLDSLWQTNRATANNIAGQVLPQGVIPALSGPVLSSPSGQSVWGSAVGALFSWEPFDLGLRHAEVAGTEAALAQARADETLTQLDVQNAAARAFLDVLVDQQVVVAAQADLDRRNILLQSIQVLVTNQLRPGADASRADAERAAARTRLLQAQQALAIGQATLARVLGLTAGTVTVVGDPLLTRLPATDISPAAPDAHPLVQVGQAAANEAHGLEDILARSDRPRLFFESSVFARGSGANPNGGFDGGASGLGLDRANWAAGVQVQFPNVFDFSSLRAKKVAAAAHTRASVALTDEARLTVTSQQQTAAAVLQTARAIAANTPVQLAAAQQSEAQARARYEAGLASIIEVADAQGLLAQAEVQDQAARIDVWRALLAAAVANGDLASFATLVRQP